MGVWEKWLNVQANLADYYTTVLKNSTDLLISPPAYLYRIITFSKLAQHKFYYYIITYIFIYIIYKNCYIIEKCSRGFKTKVNDL